MSAGAAKGKDRSVDQVQVEVLTELRLVEG